MYSKRILTSFILSVILCVFVIPMVAQERFGRVAGVVKDPSNAVLPDVAVTVTNKATNRALTMQTRADGSYTLPDVEPGRYSVLFEKQDSRAAKSQTFWLCSARPPRSTSC
jgi:hypothetical protein